VRKPNWSIVMLGAALVTLSAITLQAHTANQRHRETALALLGDYADFALFNYKSRMETSLRRVAMDAINPQHNRKLVPVYAEFGLGTPPEPRCECESLGLPIHGYFIRGPDGNIRLSRGTKADVQTLAAVLRGYKTSKNPVLLPVNQGESFIAVQPAFEIGRSDLLMGALLDRSAVIKAVSSRDCTKDLLPPSLANGLPTDSLVEIAVYAAGSADPFYTSTPEPTWLAARTDTMSPQAGNLVLRASVKQQAAPLLIIGGLPKSRLPMLLVMLAISAGLGVLAVRQMRRERALVRMRETFVTSVSHELRTPLAQVRLFLETLRMGRATTPADREWALSHIERETTRLTHLVENVLHVSKPPAQAAAAAPVLDVANELEDIVESFRPLARSRRARLVTRNAPSLNLGMRREHLRQVIINLLDNAVKYGPVGQTVTVEAQPRGDELLISVSDEGTGVLPAERDRIWQQYFRGSTPEALASGGTGIGLSIVRDLLALYGGTVRMAESETGARFEITLPRIRVGPFTRMTEDLVAHGD
jgi:signal transduction histidine kinase